MNKSYKKFALSRNLLVGWLLVITCIILISVMNITTCIILGIVISGRKQIKVKGGCKYAIQ